MGRLLLLVVVALLPIGVYAVRASTDGDARGTSTDRRNADSANLYHLYVLPLAGGAPRAIPDPRPNPYLTFGPAWSPDGKRLAVTEIDCHNCEPEVRLVDLEDARAPRRTLAVGSQPNFAPDGRTVAFVTNDSSLAVVGTDGRGRRILVDGRTGAVNRPRFSPDGGELAFMRQDRRGKWHVWTARRDGRRLRRLTGGARAESDPAWSADGKRIAFARQADNGLWHLYVVPRTGGRVRRITGLRTSDSHPSFAPDGRSVVFVRQDGPRFYLVRQRRGAQAQPLKIAPLRDAVEPAVSPDGKRLAFVARRGNAAP